MRTNQIRTLSLLRSNYNFLPNSTQNKAILPLIYAGEFFYSTLPLYSQEITKLVDINELDQIVSQISKFVDFKQIKKSYPKMFYTIVVIFIIFFISIIVLNYFLDKAVIFIIILLVVLVLFIIMFIRIVDYSFRFYSATLLQKVIFLT